MSVKKIDDCFIKLLTPNSVQSSIFFMQANPAIIDYEA